MNQKVNTGIILIAGIVVFTVAAFFIGRVLLRTAPSSTGIAPTPATSIGDIDRSGVADESDRIMVRQHVGCEKNQTCWNSVVGKTKDGDNLIYTSDLDLNKDGVINQADIELIK